MLIDTINPDVVLWSNGSPYLFDPVRNKWVGIDTELVHFSINHETLSGSQWMYHEGIPSNNSGFHVRVDSVLTIMTARCREAVNATFTLMKNGGTLIDTLVLSGESYKIEEEIDIDLDAGDWLQAFQTVDSGDVDYPHFYVGISRRS